MGSLENKEITTIGVIGAGTMGRGIVQVMATGGYRVLMFDQQPGATGEAKGFVEKMLARSVEKGRMSQEAADESTARIEICDNLDEVRVCDVVCEAIIENIDEKKDLFRRLEEFMPANAILATNTSSFSVTEIASVCDHPERVAGFHFFNPVPLMKLVEVIEGLHTSSAVTETLFDIGRQIGKEPVYVKDTPGFLVNHIGRAYMPEALRILSESIASHQEIDALMRETAGFRMGPFQLLDLVGLDVAHPVMESIYKQYYQEPMYKPSIVTRTRLVGGLLGRKTGAGFYNYASEAGEENKSSRVEQAPPRSVWISRENKEGFEAVKQCLEALAPRITIESDSTPSASALNIVTPIGEDATTAASRQGLKAENTIAVDVTFGLDRRRTLMRTPATSAHTTDSAVALFEADGVPVTVINDSPGFVAPRIVAMIINVACNIAYQNISSPADIDKGAKFGLNYPFGALEWGDHLGAERILCILEGLHAFYDEPRYRPSPWLKRRALLGMPLSPESEQ